jgi:uroporphyrinogen-III synthase
VIAALGEEDLRGRRIGVQLYPGNANDKLTDFLRAAGASIDAITPYRYASDSDDRAVVDTIRRLAAGAYDLVAFTSSPQVDRLVKVAADHDLGDTLSAGLCRTRVAAVGPLVAAAVRKAGGTVDIEPPSLFHLKPLITAISAFVAGSKAAAAPSPQSPA